MKPKYKYKCKNCGRIRESTNPHRILCNKCKQWKTPGKDQEKLFEVKQKPWTPQR